jgi:hypothetical protein
VLAVRLEETEKISGGFPFCPVQSSQVNGRSDHDLGATKFEVPGSWMHALRGMATGPNGVHLVARVNLDA